MLERTKNLMDKLKSMLAEDGREKGHDPEGTASIENFNAVLNSYGGDVYYEDHDNTWQTWKNMSPVGKLSYISVDAVRNGVSAEQFSEAVERILGGDAESRERTYQQLLLSYEKDLLDISMLIPESDHDLFAESRPLAPQLKDFLKEYGIEETASIREHEADRDFEMEL